MWHYLYFIVHLRTKDATEYTGPESFVSSLTKQNILSWFPRHQAMSLQLSPQNEDKMDNQAMYQVKIANSHDQIVLIFISEILWNGLGIFSVDGAARRFQNPRWRATSSSTKTFYNKIFGKFKNPFLAILLVETFRPFVFGDLVPLIKMVWSSWTRRQIVRSLEVRACASHIHFRTVQFVTRPVSRESQSFESHDHSDY